MSVGRGSPFQHTAMIPLYALFVCLLGLFGAGVGRDWGCGFFFFFLFSLFFLFFFPASTAFTHRFLLLFFTNCEGWSGWVAMDGTPFMQQVCVFWIFAASSIGCG